MNFILKIPYFSKQIGSSLEGVGGVGTSKKLSQTNGFHPIFCEHSAAFYQISSFIWQT